VFRFAALVLALSSIAAAPISAGELKSGPRTGDYVGSFDVIKCAGAVNDGVAVDQELCYCCELGLQPVIMVFAHEPESPSVSALLKQMEQTIAKNREHQLAGFVSLLGSDRAELIAQAKHLGIRHKLAHVALVVPVENRTGPTDFELNAQAAVTVTIYKEAQVVASYGFGKDDLKPEVIAQLMADAEKMFKK
jgi:hypothetical protein